MNIPEGDHVLVDGSAWLETNGFAIFIYADPCGTVRVSAHRVGEEADDPIAEFSVCPTE